MHCIVYIPLQSSAVGHCGFSTIFQRAVTAKFLQSGSLEFAGCGYSAG